MTTPVIESADRATDRVIVQRLDGGLVLVIEDAPSLAAIFFTKDPSSAGPNTFDERADEVVTS